MAEPTPPPTPTAAELVVQLKAKAQDWVARFSGKNNHNPFLRVAQLITPLVNTLSIKDAKVTPEIVAQVKALPADPAVLNPNYQPEPSPNSKPQATAESVGALNAKV